MKTNPRLLGAFAALMLALQLAPGAAPTASAQQQRSLAAESQAEASTAIAIVTEVPVGPAASTAPKPAASQPAQKPVQQKKIKWGPDDFVCDEDACMP